jgi:prepilin-type N-terminal cleavage/methylation domain-containing protein
MLVTKVRKGFSTVEILVAVALVAILMVVAVPRLLDSRKTVSDSSAKQQLNTVLVAVNNFFAERDTYDGITVAELQNRLPEVELVANNAATGKGSGGRALKVSVDASATEVILAASNGDENCWAIKVNTSGTQYAGQKFAATACNADTAFTSWQNFEFPNIDEA